MNDNQIDPLVASGVRLYQSFLLASTRTEQAKSRHDWASYVQTVTSSVASGSLDISTMSQIAMIASNVRSSASSLMALEQESENVVDALTEKLRDIVVLASSGKHCRRRIRIG